MNRGEWLKGALRLTASRGNRPHTAQLLHANTNGNTTGQNTDWGAAVLIIRPVRVNIPRGEVIIPKGTKLKVVSEKDDQVYVDYDGYSVPVPSSATSHFNLP